MATVDKLVAGGTLVSIAVPLGPTEGQPVRLIYGTPEFADWLAKNVQTIPTEKDADLSPAEEMDELLFNFISSKGKIRYLKTFKDLMPAKDEVWELRTYQLRIFGWFYRKDCFIAVIADTKVRMKGALAYDAAKKRVMNVRDNLRLDEPKFVGGTVDDVVSL